MVFSSVQLWPNYKKLVIFKYPDGVRRCPGLILIPLSMTFSDYTQGSSKSRVYLCVWSMTPSDFPISTDLTGNRSEIPPPLKLNPFDEQVLNRGILTYFQGSRFIGTNSSELSEWSFYCGTTLYCSFDTLQCLLRRCLSLTNAHSPPVNLLRRYGPLIRTVHRCVLVKPPRWLCEVSFRFWNTNCILLCAGWCSPYVCWFIFMKRGC